jgi:hypothetical protein
LIPCEGTGCGPVNSDCSIGNSCTESGFCVPDPACILEVPEWVGPVVTFDDLLGGIYRFLYPVAIFIGMFFIVKSGYGLMTSEGNPQKVKESQESLSAAIIGLIFVLLSVALIRVILSSILGLVVPF